MYLNYIHLSLLHTNMHGTKGSKFLCKWLINKTQENKLDSIFFSKMHETNNHIIINVTSDWWFENLFVQIYWKFSSG